MKIDRKTAGLYAVIAAFVLSRLLYYLVYRISFFSEPVNFYLQYIDIALLKNDLLRSVFYMRGQPPLFNLFLGCTVKAFANYGPAFQVVYVTTGLLLAIAMYALLVRLKIAPLLSAAITILFIAGPICVLYEN